jgi:DivIVA domain-containing protein
MDSSPTSSSILDTLRTVEFRLGLKGYNVDEVDDYLDRAAQESEALQETVRQLNERLRQAGDRIVQLERDVRDAAAEAKAHPPTPAAVAPSPTPAPTPAVPAAVAAVPAPAPTTSTALDLPSDETLQRTLLLAQKFVDQIKRESEAEAAATVAQAEEKARAAMSAAESQAAALQADSQRQVREEVARLEATRTELATDVESMARHLESERNRLRDALTEILNWVDENVQPANALMGVRPKGAPGSRPAAIASAPNEASAKGGADADDQPTLSIGSVADTNQSGVPRTA